MLLDYVNQLPLDLSALH